MSNEVLNTILTMVVVPILLALTTYILKWLKKKTDEIAKRIKANEIQQAVYDAEKVVETAVSEITETFVKEIKGTTNWTEACKIKAKNMAIEKVSLILNKATRDLLNIAFGDA